MGVRGMPACNTRVRRICMSSMSLPKYQGMSAIEHDGHPVMSGMLGTRLPDRQVCQVCRKNLEIHGIPQVCTSLA